MARVKTCSNVKLLLEAVAFHVAVEAVALHESISDKFSFFPEIFLCFYASSGLPVAGLAQNQCQWKIFTFNDLMCTIMKNGRTYFEDFVVWTCNIFKICLTISQHYGK